MNNSLQAVDNLVLRWEEEGLQLNSSADEKSILLLETRLDYQFDNDFKDYLRRTGGFKDFESDRDFFSFWSVDRIVDEGKSHHPSALVCFSDYFISLCSYGFHRENGKIYSHFQHHEQLYLIAESFSEFATIYLTDWNDLMR